MANRSASLLKSYSQEAAIEQPMAPRPTALSPEYLSWSSSSPYRWVQDVGPPPCPWEPCAVGGDAKSFAGLTE